MWGLGLFLGKGLKLVRIIYKVCIKESDKDFWVILGGGRRVLWVNCKIRSFEFWFRVRGIFLFFIVVVR